MDESPLKHFIKHLASMSENSKFKV